MPLDQSPTVGFVGLGAMGKPMANRLVEMGFELHVFNRTAKVAKTLDGVKPCATPYECARERDVVVTMMADAASLDAVLFGPTGILKALADKKERAARTRVKAHRTIVIDMSTIGRAAALRVARHVEEVGGRFVDAPVSGSVKPAGKGELVALVGGSVNAVERARPVLEALCKKVIHAGPIGQGQALKVVLNGVGAHHLIGFTSMLALGERAGLARDVLLDTFTSGAFATPSYIGKRDKLLARDYSPEFALALALKDVALNVQLQHECGVTLPVLRAILADIEKGVEIGLGDLDLFALEKRYP
jgi:3-hydroxyisobutyrate dehydrogenase-like beta-hydroxyacid dehydrogenase